MLWYIFPARQDPSPVIAVKAGNDERGKPKMPKILKSLSLVSLLVLAGTVSICASAKGGFQIEILVNGSPVPEYWLNGTTYIEALKGREYAIRLTNPLPVRAVAALSVDGLNTIDAKHTDARTASKWVLEPYETITIQGWQTSSGEARKFYFTSEENSYGAWLGKTRDLGVISAVFFKEKVRVREYGVMRKDGREAGAAPSPATSTPHKESPEERTATDELAATGIGDRFRHRVERVHLELEPQPCASFSIRYEFRPVLTRLGILQHLRPVFDPLERRRHAHGFDDMTFCPEPR